MMRVFNSISKLALVALVLLASSCAETKHTFRIANEGFLLGETAVQFF